MISCIFVLLAFLQTHQFNSPGLGWILSTKDGSHFRTWSTDKDTAYFIEFSTGLPKDSVRNYRTTYCIQDHEQYYVYEYTDK